MVQLLGSQRPWQHQLCRDSSCLSHGSYGLLDSFSSLWQLAVKRPSWLVLLCCSACQALKLPPWMVFFSIAQCIRHLKCCSLWCLSLLSSDQSWYLGRQRLQWWLHPLCVTRQFCLAFLAVWFSSPGISHHNLLLHVPLGHLPAGNSRPHPEISLQSLWSSYQPLHFLGDLHTCVGYVWLWQGLSMCYLLWKRNPNLVPKVRR